MRLKSIDPGSFSYEHVSSIHDGGVRRKADRLDDELVREIRDARKSGKTLPELSEEYCMDETVIAKLNNVNNLSLPRYTSKKLNILMLTCLTLGYLMNRLS